MSHYAPLCPCTAGGPCAECGYGDMREHACPNDHETCIDCCPCHGPRGFLDILDAVTEPFLEEFVRPDWDLYFLIGAKWLAMRGDCRRRRHGALIVNERRIISAGYNGAPAGQPGCLDGACPRGLLGYDELASLTSYEVGPGKCISIHAEANAIIHGDHDRVRGGSIYITGEPCFGCRKLIAGAGLARAVWPDGEWNPQQ